MCIRDRPFTLRGAAEYYPLPVGSETAGTRYDLAGAAATVRASELTLKAAQAQRLPSLSLNADYGGAGTNPGHFNQVYTVSAGLSVPLYTGGRIKADIEEARAAVSYTHLDVYKRQEELRLFFDSLSRVLPGSSNSARRQKAISTYALLVGGLVLARAVDDPAFSSEILHAAAASLHKEPSPTPVS